MEQETQERARPLPGFSGLLTAGRQFLGLDDQTPVGISAVYYPAVGLLLGVSMALLDLAISPRIAPPTASLVELALYVAATGGRSLSGLARTIARSLRPSAEPSRALLFGLRLVVFALAVALLAQIETGRAVALLFAPMLGACTMVVLATGSRAARRDQRQLKFAPELSFREFGIASTAVFALVFLSTNFLGLLLVLATGILTIGLRLALHWLRGGVDRDSMHGTGLFVMLTVLAIIAAL
jgi:cobalamin synthase